MLFTKSTVGMLYVAARVGVRVYMLLTVMEFRADHFRAWAKSATSVSPAGIASPFVLAFALTPGLRTVPDLFAAKSCVFEASLFLGAAFAITAYPMLARIIHERGLAGTSLGTLALTAGAFVDAAAWSILAIVLASFGGSWVGAFFAIGESAAVALFMIFVDPKLLSRLARHVDASAPLPHAVYVIVLVLFAVCALAMDAIGVNALFGGFLLGIAMPPGPLTKKLRDMLLQPFVFVFPLSMFFSYSGLNTRLKMLMGPADIWQRL